MLEEALNWWDSLSDEAKSHFPTPTCNDDIIAYYLNPADYVTLPDY